MSQSPHAEALMTSTLMGRRAVVVGAGMGGLPAARALADYFEHVVVLERDTLPVDASHRSGTPQSPHVHGLLGGGQRALADLFPGIEQNLAAAGAVPLRVGLDVRIETTGYDPFPRRDLGWISYSMSRPLIESIVRGRVERHLNITIRQRCRARFIVPTPDGAGVAAIQFENGDGKSETLPTVLIVDASGRGNLTSAFLESVSLRQPEETVIGVDIGYATAVFTIPDDHPSDWKGVRTFGMASQRIGGGLMLPLEGDRWMLTLGGRRGDKPPGDWDGFLSYAQQLRTPTIYEAVERAERVGEVARYGFPASVFRHFKRLEAFPRGLLPLGDAICRFNPIYGQGMSVAAQEACLLHQLFRKRAETADPLAGLASDFFTGAGALIDTPWAFAAVADFAFPETEGQRPEDFEDRLAFGRALNQLAAGDAAVHRLTTEVQHLLKPRAVLRDPDLVARVAAVAAQA
jgi:2-polyprenyl-6-methoxyphenol hydroxylase-like FAD-dependent oxidoreductase